VRCPAGDRVVAVVLRGVLDAVIGGPSALADEAAEAVEGEAVGGAAEVVGVGTLGAELVAVDDGVATC
jgi:hypothetical protein